MEDLEAMKLVKLASVDGYEVYVNLDFICWVESRPEGGCLIGTPRGNVAVTNAISEVLLFIGAKVLGGNGQL